MANKRDSYSGMDSLYEPKEPNGTDREVCRNFLNNRCLRGALCKFRHPEHGSPSKPSKPSERSRSPIHTSIDDNVGTTTCRDFLRNMCTRGKDCRFYHPPVGEVDKKTWFTLCLDFQNGSCTRRHDCRYFHLTPEDEDLFREHGEVSSSLIEQAIQKAPNLDVAIKSSRPTCKDYLKGYCKFKLCRFRHVSRPEFEEEVYRALKDELYELIGSHLGGPKSLGQEGTGNFSPGSIVDKRKEGGMGMKRSSISTDASDHLKALPFPRDTRVSLNKPQASKIMQSYHYPPLRHNDTLALDRRQNYSSNSGRSFSLSGFSTGSFGDHNSRLQDEFHILQMEHDSLRQRVNDLMRELDASQNWESLYYEAKEKLLVAQRQIEDQSRTRVPLDDEDQTSKEKSKLQEKFKLYVMEQAEVLQSHLTVVENELSQLWGGGPPPRPSQRDAWNRLRSLVMLLVNPEPEEETTKYQDIASANSDCMSAGATEEGASPSYSQQPSHRNSSPSPHPPPVRSRIDSSSIW